jgi:hypothetical protein
MRSIAFLFIVLFIISCESSEEKNNTENAEEFVFDMYKPSEMSHLMLSMYDFNEKIRKEILAGNTPDKFPEEFLNIFSASLTDNKPHNEIFKAYSKVYIDNESFIFDTESNIPLKERYNNTINACISCHTTECVGPIPRIKKLLIN